MSVRVYLQLKDVFIFSLKDFVSSIGQDEGGGGGGQRLFFGNIKYTLFRGGILHPLHRMLVCGLIRNGTVHLCITTSVNCKKLEYAVLVS